ncbi:MAG: SDR family NAD(P)-dependent oxidoreductase, partial [Ramlibacter sp.]|nr:SDR family NAD(P)-dependent oxidoreductase [Ramlibacter sp.]
MKRILVIGATSGIAQATVRLWAAQGHSLYLAGRARERLDALAADLR